jgi:hypothetical protein
VKSELAAGLRYGAFGAAGLSAVALGRYYVATPSKRPRAAPFGGAVLVAATVAALHHTHLLPHALPWALVALTAAGVAVDFGAPVCVGVLLAVPGAWWLAASTGVPAVGWVKVAIAVVAAAGGGLVAGSDRRLGRWSLLVVLVTAGGVYGTVPDTEQALALLGAAIAIAFAFWAARLGAAGSWAFAGLVAWTAAVGGVGRHSSIVGGLACLGVLLVAPLWPRRVPAFAIAAAQWPVVFVASRVAGLRPTTGGVGRRRRGGSRGAAARPVSCSSDGVRSDRRRAAPRRTLATRTARARSAARG